MDATTQSVLCLHRADEQEIRRLGERFELTEGGPDDPSPRVVITNSVIGFTNDAWKRWPDVGLVHFLGSGLGKIDLDTARLRKARVTSGAGVHSACVADHAMALLLALLRQVPGQDRSVRKGCWRANLPLAQVSGRRVGLMGFGTIGQQLARRLAGFDVSVGYFARRCRADRAERFFPSALELAGWADDLIISLPESEHTRHLVGQDIFTALGPEGCVVNVGRGATVDTDALVAALGEGRIRGAGLDVYESEPEVRHELLRLENTVLTPHSAGHSPTSRMLLWNRAISVVRDFLAGRDLDGADL